MADVITVFPPRAKAITPSNSADLTDSSGTTPQAQNVFVGVAGNVAVIPSGNADGSTPVVFAVPAGGCVPVLVKRVMSTNTTASSLVGVW